MIHIIDPTSWPTPPNRPAGFTWEQIITPRQLHMAYLVAERLPDGRYKVVKCRWLINDMRDVQGLTLSKEELNEVVSYTLGVTDSWRPKQQTEEAVS